MEPPPDQAPIATVTVTNTYTTGSLVIRKEVSGPGAPAFSQGPFVFGVSCDYQGVEDVYSVAVVVSGSPDGTPVESDPVTGLPIGAVCTVTEIDSGGADIVTPPQTVTIEENEQANVAFVGVNNPFSAGTVSVVKAVDGSAASSAYVAGLDYTDRRPVRRRATTARSSRVLDDDVTVAGDGVPVTVVDDAGNPMLVPLGARCWGAEPDPARRHRASRSTTTRTRTASRSSPTPTAGVQPLQITVTNTFDAAHLIVRKVVVNAADPNAVYTFDVACTTTDSDGTTIDTPLLSGESPFTLGGGESATFDVLVGSTCTVRETDVPGGATLTYSEAGGGDDGADDGVVVVGPDVIVTATNEFESGVSPEEVLPATL